MQEDAPVQYVEVACGDSPRFKDMVALRSRILREPLGLAFTDEDKQSDRTAIHLAALSGDAVIGTILLIPHNKETAKFRQMAVDPAYRGQGVGKRLLAYAERRAGESGVRQIVLHARVTAAGFYEKAGYRREGDSFLEVGIPHVKMTKSIKALRRQ